MAFGLPVVATRFASAGVDGAEPGVHFLAGDDAVSLAGRIVDILRGADVAELRRNARSLVESAYSIEALTERLRLWRSALPSR
jgi:glycosyltransferase involved in cell wall biosynthesis